MIPYNNYIKIKNAEIERIIMSWGFTKNDIFFAEKKTQALKWFKNFEPKEYELALEILKVIQYKQQHEIDLLIDKIAKELINIFSDNLKNVLFFPLGKSSAASGSIYLYSLLKNLHLSENGFIQENFKKHLNTDVDIVFIDDIIGSGNQAIRFYNNNLKNTKAKLFYISLFAFNQGIEAIKEKAGFDLVFSGEYISNQLSAFSEKTYVFKDKKKRKEIETFCLKYGNKLYPKHPLGYNNTQSLIVFPHNTPNNTLPIIWASHSNEKEKGITWFPLWERKKYVINKSRIEKKSKKVNKILDPLLKEIIEFINKNNYNRAEEIYNKANNIENLDDYSLAKLKIQYSHILKNKYYDTEKEDKVLIECLNVFQKHQIIDDINTVKRLLIQTKANLQDYNTAEIFANDVLESAKTVKDLADAHVFLGFILIQKQDLIGAKSEMDKAIKYGNRLILKNEKEQVDYGIETITFATQNNSLIFKRLGKLEEAKSSSIKAIEGLRKLKKKKKLGMALFELTELSLLQGNFKDEKWTEYIEEAKTIFRELKDFSWLARCYDLVAKIAFMSNQPELALKIFEEGYREIQKTNDKNGVAHFLGKFVSFYIHQNDIENAKKSLSKLVEYAENNNIERAITESKKYSLKIAEIDGGVDNKEEYLNNLISEYEKEYNSEQSEITKLFILGKIASIYEEQNKLILALNTFKKVSKKYKELDIKSEYAKSLLMINQLKIKLGDRDDLLEIWQEVLKILDGTSYYSLIAVANINCGSYLLETRNFEKAQRYLEEAEYYVLKYKLPNKKDVEELLKEVRDRRDFTKPAEWTFEHMVNRLYFGISKRKDVLEPLLRHWYYKYQEDLIKHFSNKSGLNNIMFSDNIQLIYNFTNNLSWLFNYFLVVSDENFSTNSDIIDCFEYPYENAEKGDHLMVKNTENKEGIENDLPLEKQLLNYLNKPINGKFPPYVFFPVLEKGWKNFKVFLGGKAFDLPSIAYSFIKNNNAKSVLNSKYFPLHFDRYRLKDKLFTDIILCWEINYFPIYLNENLSSDRITTLAKTKINIPFETEFNKSKSNSIKKLFNSLFIIEKSNAKTSLNDFKFEIDILTEDMEKSISLNISIVEVQHSVRKFVYPIIVINEELD